MPAPVKVSIVILTFSKVVFSTQTLAFIRVLMALLMSRGALAFGIGTLGGDGGGVDAGVVNGVRVEVDDIAGLVAWIGNDATGTGGEGVGTESGCWSICSPSSREGSGSSCL